MQILPSAGIGSLSTREAEGRTNVVAGEKETHKLLQPADKTLKTMAIEFAEAQVCVDIFLTTQSYIDIASISVVPRTTGGQVYYYHPFSALSDSAKLYNDLRWNITRPQGFEAVMRVRCSQIGKKILKPTIGLQVQDYSGNFCKRIPTDVDLPGCALLYTTVYGQRRIRVHTLSLPCTSVLSNLFRTADLDTQFTGFLKQAANEIPTSPLVQVREQITNLCVNILYAYRKFCATVSSSGQLILPEALKLLPLYTLALVKSTGLRTDGRIDDRSYWVSHVASLSTPLAVPLVYPRMMAIHNLASKETDESLLPPTIPLSSEHVSDDGIFLLENGEDCLIYVGNMVTPDTLRQLFGVPSVEAIPAQFLLEQYDSELSKKVNHVLNEIRRQRSSYLRKGDTSAYVALDELKVCFDQIFSMLRFDQDVIRGSSHTLPPLWWPIRADGLDMGVLLNTFSALIPSTLLFLRAPRHHTNLRNEFENCSITTNNYTLSSLNEAAKVRCHKLKTKIMEQLPVSSDSIAVQWDFGMWIWVELRVAEEVDTDVSEPGLLSVCLCPCLLTPNKGYFHSMSLPLLVDAEQGTNVQLSFNASRMVPKHEYKKDSTYDDRNQTRTDVFASNEWIRLQEHDSFRPTHGIVADEQHGFIARSFRDLICMSRVYTLL
ncbi:Protein transport protein Sec24C [Asimina triloba]